MPAFAIATRSFVGAAALFAASASGVCDGPDGSCPAVDGDASALLQLKSASGEGTKRSRGPFGGHGARTLSVDEDYCEEGASVKCPHSENVYCEGQQCCPGNTATGSFPCPSAPPSFGPGSCQSNQKEENCLRPPTTTTEATTTPTTTEATTTTTTFSGVSVCISEPGCACAPDCVEAGMSTCPSDSECNTRDKCLAKESCGCSDACFGNGVYRCPVGCMPHNTHVTKPWTQVDGPPEPVALAAQDYCEEGASVKCPHSENVYCEGQQCCPGTTMTGSFPCPSAPPSFGPGSCQSNQKVENCLRPPTTTTEATTTPTTTEATTATTTFSGVSVCISEPGCACAPDCVEAGMSTCPSDSECNTRDKCLAKESCGCSNSCFGRSVFRCPVGCMPHNTHVTKPWTQ